MVHQSSTGEGDDRISARSIRHVELELKKTRLKAEIARLEIREVELALWLECAKEGHWMDLSQDSQSFVLEPKTDQVDNHWHVFELAAWQRLATLPSQREIAAVSENAVATDSSAVSASLPECELTAKLLSAETHSSTVNPSEYLAIQDDAIDSGPTNVFDGIETTRLAIAPVPELQAAEPDRLPSSLQKKRFGGAALSALVHAAALLFLTFWTLQSHDPRDVLALSAAVAADTPSESLESIQIESAAEPESTPQESSAESELAVDPLGALPKVNMLGQAGPVASPSNSLSNLLQTTSNSAASLSALTAEVSSTTFCGLSSGGTRLCFLVDSSKSMSKGRFEAARSELLTTIDSLPSDKRFYVIFYSTVVAPMCLGSAEPAEYLTSASPENKRALRTWAMTVEMERGAPPDNALRKAFALKPEVIFLLTDGEFSDRTETLLTEINLKESFFGESGRHCLIHTIAFHSKAGVERLSRIASTHGGRFRYVEPPK